MQVYRLVHEISRWTLRNESTHQPVQSFESKRQALRESLGFVHHRGATLILDPERRAPGRSR